MNILICDDIRDDALKLEKAVKNTIFEADITVFEKGNDVLEYIKSGAKIDVCFLDIIMPDINGIEVARYLRQKKYYGKIIFLTNSNDYGVESYQVKAFSYLLKPFSLNDIKNIFQEIQDTNKIEDKAGLPITNRNMKKYLYFHEISYIEVMRNSVYFHLLNMEDIIITAALSDILPRLDGRFAQCHRSFVVNMDVVTQIHGKDVFLRCGRKVPIARNNKDFDEQYFLRVMGKDL